MKTLACILLLLPALAFGCPNLTGTYHCDVKKFDTNTVLHVDIHIETNDNVYTLSTTRPGIEPVRWVADGIENSYLAPIPDGIIIHTIKVSCENNKMHLIETQKWYHDISPEELKPDTPPVKFVSISEFLSLDTNGNLVRDDTWTKGNLGESKTENIPMTCNKIKEEQK